MFGKENIDDFYQKNDRFDREFKSNTENFYSANGINRPFTPEKHKRQKDFITPKSSSSDFKIPAEQSSEFKQKVAIAALRDFLDLDININTIRDLNDVLYWMRLVGKNTSTLLSYIGKTTFHGLVNGKIVNYSSSFGSFDFLLSWTETADTLNPVIRVMYPNSDEIDELLNNESSFRLHISAVDWRSGKAESHYPLGSMNAPLTYQKFTRLLQEAAGYILKSVEANNPTFDQTQTDPISRPNTEIPTEITEANAEAQLQAITALFTKLTGDKAELTRQNTELQESTNKSTARVSYLESKVEELIRNQETATAEKSSLLRRVTNLQSTVTNLESTIESLKIQLRTAKISAGPATNRRIDPQGYYKALGIDPEFLQGVAQDKVERIIQSAYRAASLAMHPDHGGSVERMKTINVAYEFLSKATNRRGYSR